uniref:Uncharacterized protein n=1 Tax=Varanus komodoensis TaxID=61221 RepID=A0A8D2IHE5_VARKO
MLLSLFSHEVVSGPPRLHGDGELPCYELHHRVKQLWTPCLLIPRPEGAQWALQLTHSFPLGCSGHLGHLPRWVTTPILSHLAPASPHTVCSVWRVLLRFGWFVTLPPAPSRPAVCPKGLWRLAGGRSTASAPSIKKGSVGDKSPARSPSPKRQLKKKHLPKVGRQSCCDSNSTGSDRVGSQLSWWSRSLSGDSLSMSSQKARRTAWKRSDAVREQPCLRCKAKRTREWLAQHFFQPMFFPQEKSN